MMSPLSGGCHEENHRPPQPEAECSALKSRYDHLSQVFAPTIVGYPLAVRNDPKLWTKAVQDKSESIMSELLFMPRETWDQILSMDGKAAP